MLEQIGKYKVLAKIGQGAMGEVYKAHDAVLNRDVAIKTIAADLNSDDTLRKRFEREAQSAARLNHPNVVTVYDFGEEHDKVFMAMELLEGHDLKHAIAHRTLPDMLGRLSIMEQICDGLAFAHANEIVHRDLKPANIHLQPNGQVKVMDFGLARLAGSEMTRTGMVMGTPHYMSPEQVRGERADARSDIFALGCVFYEMLTFKKPFDADSMHAVLFKVMQEEAPPISELAPETPLVLVEILDKALMKDPDERFQEAGELREAVHAARQAVLAGRGEDLLDDVLRASSLKDAREGSRTPTPGSDAKKPSPRSGGGSGSAKRSGPGRVSTGIKAQPAAPPPASSKAPLIGGGVALAALAMLGGWYATRRPEGPAATLPASTRPAQVDSLAQAVVGTQIELARKRLDAGDFKEAARQAEKALRLDPSNKEAGQIHAAARKVLDDIDAAVAAVRAAKGDASKEAAALWTLLQADPDHELATELAPAHEAGFVARAEDAHRLMSAAKATADAAKATTLDAYREAAAAVTEGDAALKARKGVTAARRFLAARTLYDRARQSMK